MGSKFRADKTTLDSITRHESTRSYKLISSIKVDNHTATGNGFKWTGANAELFFYMVLILSFFFFKKKTFFMVEPCKIEYMYMSNTYTPP